MFLPGEKRCVASRCVKLCLCSVVLSWVVFLWLLLGVLCCVVPCRVMSWRVLFCSLVLWCGVWCWVVLTHDMLQSIEENLSCLMTHRQQSLGA